jgi:hypothetical protein
MTRQRIIQATVLAILAAMPAAALARGGGHGGHSSALMAPGAPSVPPSLTPDSRLTGQAPLPPAHEAAGGPKKGFEPARDPEDAKIDKMIASICKGC